MEMTKYSVDADILENSYVDKMANANFLFEQERNTIKLNSFISECLCIAEGGNIYDGIKAINEGISDKAESAWDKVMDFLRRMWGKFVENMTNLFNSNGYYLEKYKDIILKKPIKFTEKITMPNYFNGIKNIVGVKIPLLNVQSLERIPLNAEDKTGMDNLRTEFMNAWRNGKPADNPNGKEFKAWAVDYFKGLGTGEVDFTASQINMTDMYNFCHDSKNITSTLEKDKSAIERASKEFADEVKNVMSKADKDGYNTNDTGEANDYDKAEGKLVHTNGSNYTYTITVNNQVKSYNATSKKVDGKWGVYLGNDYPGNKSLVGELKDIVTNDPNYELANKKSEEQQKTDNKGTGNTAETTSNPKINTNGNQRASNNAKTSTKINTNGNQRADNNAKTSGKTTEAPQVPNLTGRGSVNSAYNQKIKEESAFIYSRVFDRYITEDEVTYSGNGDTTNNTGTGGGGTTAAAVTRANSADANANGRYDVKGAVNVKSTDKTIEDKAKVWLGIATEVVTAKMTAVDAINKSFMQIIKNHVQYYVGRTNIENDQAASQGTNYNNQSTGQDNQAPAGEKTGGQPEGQPQPDSGGQPPADQNNK